MLVHTWSYQNSDDLKIICRDKKSLDKKSNLGGCIIKLSLILLDVALEPITLHLTTCPTWYIVLGPDPGSNPSSDLVSHLEH